MATAVSGQGVKTESRLITPEFANQTLENHNKRVESGLFRQRNVRDDAVNSYAMDMKRGNWILNHQGIAFNEEGDLIDGQHRLYAVKKSGCSVWMMVTTGLPVQVRNGITLNTMDTIDCGRVRSVGNQLTISHGISAGNKYSATVTNIIKLIVSSETGSWVKRPTFSQVVFALGIYQKDIEAIESCGETKGSFKSGFLAAMAICHNCLPEESIKFAKNFIGLENLPGGDPALTLYKNLPTYSRNQYSSGSANRTLVSNVVCSAFQSHFLKRKTQMIRPNGESVKWILKQQPANVEKICKLFGFKPSFK